MSRRQHATVRDVAALAGVSTATVSRCFDPDLSHLVTAETRQKVLTAAEELHFTINHVARSLKTKSTKTVAVIAPELSNDFFMELTEAMDCILEQAGYTLLVASSSNSVEEEQKRISLFAERLVDGIIVIPAGSQGDHLQHLACQGMPILLVDRLVEGCSLGAVLSENETGSAALTRALIQDGYSRIAFVGGDISISTARERLAGYGRAMAEAGLSVEGDLIRLGGMGVSDGYQRMDELLQSRNPPEALVAVNLLVHLGMQRRLLEDIKQGYPLPSFAVAAFDQTAYSAFLPFCKYIAAQDIAGLGRLAAERILIQIDEVKRIPSTGTVHPIEPEIVRLPVTILPVNSHRIF
ncbi:LacI family DNA-binding transcriptional regulator [Gracilinema caldarium]|uniref:Transcriptional regulator, LacI family n=1 Tax=Gracilinema caldarium (strain ATCC 51460 / DSM 7334 / H1) TaxID=744872 RepID=F8F332_GRAC1|nr:LacI family DNA-binding transcriptional regulator [Gracilinema caldarium]AEJ20358.1 transcriptional regulator, LacI family [Gracilinema caldarium DSM 7334]